MQSDSHVLASCKLIWLYPAVFLLRRVNRYFSLFWFDRGIQNVCHCEITSWSVLLLSPHILRNMFCLFLLRCHVSPSLHIMIFSQTLSAELKPEFNTHIWKKDFYGNTKWLEISPMCCLSGNLRKAFQESGKNLSKLLPTSILNM